MRGDVARVQELQDLGPLRRRKSEPPQALRRRYRGRKGIVLWYEGPNAGSRVVAHPVRVFALLKDVPRMGANVRPNLVNLGLVPCGCPYVRLLPNVDRPRWRTGTLGEGKVGTDIGRAGPVEKGRRETVMSEVEE